MYLKRAGPSPDRQGFCFDTQRPRARTWKSWLDGVVPYCSVLAGIDFKRRAARLVRRFEVRLDRLITPFRDQLPV